MTKVLVVDHQSSIRKALTQSLGQSGYDVGEATNGRAALEIASREPIDLVLLDVEMPGMDGCQVLTKLKGDPQTRSIPVIMLTSFPSVETEAASLRSGANHILAKPCHPETLARTVRVVLRETQNAVAREPRTLLVSTDVTVSRDTPSEPSNLIDTGGRLILLERALSGGLPLESLTLIEGPSDAGKTVMAQYLMFGAVLGGRSVAYFTSEHNADSLGQRMSSIGLDVSGALQADSLRVYPLDRASANASPEAPLAALATELEGVPAVYKLIVVDGITDLALASQDRAIIGFFSNCQRLSSNGTAIAILAQSSAFDPGLLGRLHSLCNSHISMATRMFRDNLVRTLTVAKVNNVEKHTDNGFSFRIEPGEGVKIIPIGQVKA